MVADRDYTIACEFSHRPGDRGVVFALGDPIAGMALFSGDDGLVFEYHGGQGHRARCERMPAVEGKNAFELNHRAIGNRKGVGTVALNGETVATLDMSPTTILGLGVGEGLDIGCDRRLHVADYGGSGACAYTGEVAYVRIEPGPQAKDSYANRPERLAQRD